MAKIFEIWETRQRQIRLAKLNHIFGERFDCVFIPPSGMELKDLVYIFPPSYMRRIEDLTLKEMDDLLDGQLNFFIT